MDVSVEILVKGIGKLDIGSKEVESFGVPLVFNLSDITSLDTRKSSFSKTIKIIGSKNNNLIFNQLYEIKGQDFSFKMTKKHDCVLLVNKAPIMDGFLVLKKISKLLIGSKYQIIYEINMFDESKNFFDDIDGKMLGDLDFSSSYTYTGTTTTETYEVGDHILTSQLVGEVSNNEKDYLDVYTYPVIDYGYTISSGQTFPYTAVSKGITYPVVFEKAIVDKIFLDAGYTYESNFLDGTSYSGFFKKLVNMYNKGTNFVNLELCEYMINGGLYIPVSTYYIMGLGRNSCQLDYLSKYYELDPSYLITKQIGTGTTSEWGKGIEIPRDDDYKFKFRVKVIDDKSGTYIDDGAAYPPTSPTAINPSHYHIMKYDPVENENIILKSYVPDDMKSSTGLTSLEYAWTYSNETETFELKQNDFIYLKIYSGSVKIQSPPYPPEHWISDATDLTLDGISLELIQVRDLLPEYSGTTTPTIYLNRCLPEMTQSDFIRNLIKMFNLFVWSNKEDSKRLFIEPRDDFYRQGTLQNWTKKVDYNKDIIIKSLTDKISNNMIFKYTDGEDYDSQRYIDTYNETYGTKNIDLTNSYLKKEQKVELDYQSYLMKGDDKLYPKLYDKDNPEQTFLDDKLAYDPLIGFIYNSKPPNNDLKIANYVSGTPTSIRNKKIIGYNYVAHAKILGGDSFDLNYETTGQTFTLSNYDNTRGLYKIFWENYINNIIDDDSRIVEMYIMLELTDVLNLDFRNRVDIDGQRYFVEKVEYDASSIKSSKVTLLKEIDTIDEGSFNIYYLLKNDSGDYILTDDNDKIIIN